MSFTQNHATKTYEGAEEVNLHGPADLSSGRIPGTSWTGICAGQSRLSRSVEKICMFFFRESNYDSSIDHPQTAGNP